MGKEGRPRQQSAAWQVPDSATKTERETRNLAELQQKYAEAWYSQLVAQAVLRRLEEEDLQAGEAFLAAKDDPALRTRLDATIQTRRAAEEKVRGLAEDALRLSQEIAMISGEGEATSNIKVAQGLIIPKLESLVEQNPDTAKKLIPDNPEWIQLIEKFQSLRIKLGQILKDLPINPDRKPN